MTTENNEKTLIDRWIAQRSGGRCESTWLYFPETIDDLVREGELKIRGEDADFIKEVVADNTLSIYEHEAASSTARYLHEMNRWPAGRPIGVLRSWSWLRKLFFSFSRPVEDGFDHPSEELVGQWHSAWPSVCEEDLISIIRVGDTHGLVANIIRCVGRLDVMSDDFRVEVVRLGLASNDVADRDAAVQAAENWGGDLLLQLLRAHEDETPWMRDYIEDVISDLSSGPTLS